MDELCVDAIVNAIQPFAHLSRTEAQGTLTITRLDVQVKRTPPQVDLQAQQVKAFVQGGHEATVDCES